MAFFTRGPNEDPDDFLDRMGKMIPPGQIHRQLRQALQFCWFSLPRDKRNAEGFEAEARRVFEQALRDMRDDFGKLGLSDSEG